MRKIFILCAPLVLLASCGSSTLPQQASGSEESATVSVNKYPNAALGEFGVVQPDELYSTPLISSLDIIGNCPDPAKAYAVCYKTETAQSYALKSDTPRQVTATQKYWVCGNAEVSFDVYKAKVAAGASGCFESTRQVVTGTQHICLWGRYQSVYKITNYYKYGQFTSTSKNLETYSELTGQDISRTLTTTCPSKPTV